MKKQGIFNSKIASFIASVGHKDMITIVDMGYPIPKGIDYADLVVDKGKPSFIETINAVLKELEVEKVIIAEEMEKQNIVNYEKIMNTFLKVEIERLPYEDFKKFAKFSKFFIRTGECTPYSNIILVSGVIF